MRKSKTTAFLLLLFYIGKFIFCQKTYLENVVYIVTFGLPFFHMEGYWKCSNTNAHIDIHWLFRRHTSIQKLGNRLGILTQILMAMDHFFYLYIWIYLLRNCFSNYVYLKDTYITLKGIGKVLFVSVLRILLICKFLKFTTVFTKKIKVSKVCIQLSVRES